MLLVLFLLTIVFIEHVDHCEIIHTSINVDIYMMPVQVQVIFRDSLIIILYILLESIDKMHVFVKEVRECIVGWVDVERVCSLKCKRLL